MIMNTTKIRIGIFVAAIFLCVLAAPVSADWDEGGSYKMHQPQLPDPNGLDVFNYNGTSLEPLLLADDWLCTETGLVTDIHIWGSWSGDINGSIDSFNVSIWSNDPGTSFSHPDERLWQHTFNQSEFTERYWGNGTQGGVHFAQDQTYVSTSLRYNDHNDTYQCNLRIDPAKAFIQQEGTTYWLAIAPYVNDSFNYRFGWKTSETRWEDDFVAETHSAEPSQQIEGMWFYWDRPSEYSSYSLAFVIDGPSLPERCIEIEKLINGEDFVTAFPGDTMEVTLRVNNCGDVNLTNLSVRDYLPLKKFNAGLSYTYISDPYGLEISGISSPENLIYSHIVWDNLTQFEPLQPGENFTITFEATVDELAEGPYENCATVSANYIIPGAISGTVNATDCATVFVPSPVPILTPTGIIALLSALSAIATVTLIRKRR